MGEGGRQRSEERHEREGQAAAGTAVEAELLERQRRRIAFDLHDGPCQVLSAALLQVSLVDSMNPPAAVREGLSTVRELIVAALDEIQEMAAELRPLSLDGDGLSDRLEGYLKELRRRSDLDVVLHVEGEPTRLSSSAQITVFRIVQEALTNIRKHADAASAVVCIRVSEEDITCRITDDGRGLDPSSFFTEEADVHKGLRFMAERTMLLDGTIDISSAPGVGTAISIWLPRWN